MPTFYRVLDDAPDIKGPRHHSPYRRWMRGEYNCTHNACPPEWINAWNAGKRAAGAFNLHCADGLHTPSALDIFLEAAEGHNSLAPSEPPGGDPITMGQLEGTCAFQEPKQAWTYVLGNEENPASLTKVQMTSVVVFEGEDLHVAIPEKKGGGVQVRVINPGTMYSAVRFAELHGFQLPDDDKGDDIELGPAAEE